MPRWANEGGETGHTAKVSPEEGTPWGCLSPPAPEGPRLHAAADYPIATHTQDTSHPEPPVDTHLRRSYLYAAGPYRSEPARQPAPLATTPCSPLRFAAARPLRP